MTIINDSSPARIPRWLDAYELGQIKRFLRDAVNHWLDTHDAHEGFAARDLVSPQDWGKKPLMVLDDSQDLGWILKDVLQSDMRNFESYSGWSKKYKLVP